MDTLLSMKVLLAVVDHASFVQAAEHLGLSKAMVSKHVMHLENRLGARLLNRNSRHLSVTESGRVYLERCRAMLEELDEVEATVSRATVTPRGTIRFTAPMWLATDYFTRLLREFREHYPEVTFDIDISGRFVDIVEEGFDLALRASRTLHPNLIARPLMTIPFYIVASPGYLERHGTPEQGSDLERHGMLAYSLIRGKEFTLTGPEGEVKINFNSVLQSNNESLLLSAAVNDMGIAILPGGLVERELGQGNLTQVLPGYTPLNSQLYAVYTSRRYLSAKVRTFIDFLSDRMECPEHLQS
ncbi:MAG: LysR family transcriptional regulator [Saccharospirillum sp.]|uniref:LysR family transcriptional regulator n=1 Tax=Saccharospirillum sp. TaxID=2033801 RepID=UPI0032987FAC